MSAPGSVIYLCRPAFPYYATNIPEEQMFSRAKKEAAH
jgi:hypothetical protein